MTKANNQKKARTLKGKSKAQVRLGDFSKADIINVWEEHGCNASSVARTLGVSRQAVSRHLKHAGVTGGQRGRAALEKRSAGGQAAASVATLVNKNSSVSFRQGVRVRLEEMTLLARLNSCAGMLDDIKISIDAEVQKQDGRYKPYQVDQMLKLIGRIESLTEKTFNMKTKLYENAATESFIRAVVDVLRQEIPDAQRRIYIKLANIGFEEQLDC